MIIYQFGKFMKTIKTYHFLVLGLLVVCLAACDSEKKTSSESQDADSLLIKYQALADSVSHNWTVMIAADDDKHTLMKRLLLEVSYTNNYDKPRFEELNALVDELKDFRYDQKTMSDSDLIDAYDSATWDLTDQIIKFARDHPRFEDFPMMQELIEDINGKNSYVLMHRIHYDNWVKELNSFKEKNRDKLMHDDTGVDVESMPLFELPS
jgi:hypothetical protein